MTATRTAPSFFPHRKTAAGAPASKLAESLGGVESLIELPAIMTHASVPPEVRAEIGLPDGLIRLSCGVEDLPDLQADLDRAFAAAAAG